MSSPYVTAEQQRQTAAFMDCNLDPEHLHFLS